MRVKCYLFLLKYSVLLPANAFSHLLLRVETEEHVCSEWVNPSPGFVSTVAK